jgi:UDP-glucose 4-epimerase
MSVVPVQQYEHTILVTGGAGYIGSHFVNRYLQQYAQHRILVVDDLSTGNIEAINALTHLYGDRLIFKECSIGSELLPDLLRDCAVKAVVHFAASSLVSQSQVEPLYYLKNNVGQTLRLLDSLQMAEVKQIVFSSTAAVYGTPNTDLILETENKLPVNVYGRTKLMVEGMLDLLNERGMLSYVTLRYFNAAGADPSGLIGEGHHEETHLIPIVLQVANGKRAKLKIYGNDYDTPDGTCIRDYIHINDLSDAHIAALDYLKQHPGAGEVFNLGTGHGDSVQEVVNTCQKITGKTIPLEIAARREGDPPVLVAGADKARQLLGWQPQYGLEDIIKTAWQWEQNRKFCFYESLIAPI